MTYEAWLQNIDGEEITVLEEMDVATAERLQRALTREHLSGVLAGCYLMEHSETANTAIEEVEIFLERARQVSARD